jgi:hypothetical protein
LTPYTFTQLGTTGKYSATAELHNLQFTVTHSLGFLVFTSCILATDLSQSHCYFESHRKSSLHRLIPFLQFAVTLDCHSQTSTQFSTASNLKVILCPCIIPRHGPRRKHSLSVVVNVFLLIHCITMIILLLRSWDPRECVYPVVA